MKLIKATRDHYRLARTTQDYPGVVALRKAALDRGCVTYGWVGGKFLRHSKTGVVQVDISFMRPGMCAWCNTNPCTSSCPIRTA